MSMETRRLRLLIVDGDARTRRCLKSLVGQAAAECMEAGDGDEALALARARRPDLIITAWSQPGLDGDALVRALKREGEPPHVLVTLARPDEPGRAAALAAGADDFICTPLEAGFVAARLRAAQRLIRYQHVNAQQKMRLGHYEDERVHLHRRLRELAVTDELTGLANRRHALERLQQAWSAAERQQAALACMVIKVAGLKRINQHYGHERGDVVLKTAAAIVRSRIRAQYLLCRLGGDKFLIICPEASLPALIACGTRLLDTFKGLRRGAENIEAGFCIGVAERRPGVDSAEALLNLASLGSADAERHGGNRVRCVQLEAVRRRRAAGAAISVAKTTLPA